MAHRGRHTADHFILTGLAWGMSVRATAKRAGVSERTVHRRLEEEGFRKELAKVKADLIARTTAGLTGLGTKAVRTLNVLLDGTDAKVRLGAARAALELAVKLRQAEEMEERVKALEAAAALRENNR